MKLKFKLLYVMKYYESVGINLCDYCDHANQNRNYPRTTEFWQCIHNNTNHYPDCLAPLDKAYFWVEL